MDDFMAELDEDVEGMQSTIILLQQQLRSELRGSICGGDAEHHHLPTAAAQVKTQGVYTV